MRKRLDDSGSALIMVLGAMMVLTMIITVAATVAMRTASYARHTSDWNAALVAADAGVDDYLARLNRDESYWQASPDCTNIAMRRPNAGACGWNASTAVGWAPVPLSSRAQFHYDAETTLTPSNGAIKLTSTGRVGAVTRTIQTVLRRAGFGEFLYYSVYETIDPANEAVFGVNNTTAQDKCAHYAWEPYVSGVSKPRDASYCPNIQFVTGDNINGPLHSNDTILMNGRPRFQGPVTTSRPSCQPIGGVPRPSASCYAAANGSTAPQFDRGIAYRAEIDLPTSIGDLKQHVDPAQTNTPGCLYTGPTRIQIQANPSGAHSTMKVWSPWSKSPLNPGCGDYQAAWPQTVPIPHNNMVFVRDVPSTQLVPSSAACVAGTIGDFPQSNDVTQTLRESSCRYGTLYVDGTLHGRVTLAADNDIVITGDLTYADGKTGLDSLGLIAQNSVKLYHPVRCTNTSNGRCTDGVNLARPTGGAFSNPTVQASILTLNHSFTVQSYDLGSPLGSLHLFGSFAQRFRGPVGTNNGGSIVSGYLKDYEYDTRLRYSPPPFFLDPVGAAWGVKAYGEMRAAY